MKFISIIFVYLALIQVPAAMANIAPDMFPVVGEGQWRSLIVQQSAIVTAELAVIAALQQSKGPEVQSLKDWHYAHTISKVKLENLRKHLRDLTVDPKLRAMQASLDTADVQMKLQKMEEFRADEKAAIARGNESPTNPHQTLHKDPSERTAAENRELTHPHRFTEAQMENLDREIERQQSELVQTLEKMGASSEDIATYPIKTEDDTKALRHTYNRLNVRSGEAATQEARQLAAAWISDEETSLARIESAEAQVIRHSKWFRRAFRLVATPASLLIAANIAAQLTLIYGGRDPGLLAARLYVPKMN